jgi:hypothetical protein
MMRRVEREFPLPLSYNTWLIVVYYPPSHARVITSLLSTLDLTHHTAAAMSLPSHLPLEPL